jgi:uncharacterized protein YgbK (DUF1537 family)
VALGIAADLVKRGVLSKRDESSSLEPITGRRAILAGSCSTATQAQVAAAISAGIPAFAIDPLRLAAGEPVVSEALQWAHERLEKQAVLIYATASRKAVQVAQAALGIERAAALVEDALASIATGLIDAGVRQLIVAGGETSGAVVKALNVDGLRIGPQIVPGVPWTTTMSPTPINLVLKSGNFGAEEFFLSSWLFLAPAKN